MLIAATAILLTILPVLRRSTQGARSHEHQASKGAAPAEPQRRTALVREAPGEAREVPGVVPAAPGEHQARSLAGWARHRRQTRQPSAGEHYDEHEVEQMVREKLYGSRGRKS